ncbi:MAG: 4-alpha-glucanotransferase, partial [Bacilli bacterium]
MKQAGILIGISSLPSNYGIGDLGANAYHLVDQMASNKIKIWQILPFNRLGFGNSPYQTYSSIAGDEIFISIDKLIQLKLLQANDISSTFNNTSSINYDQVRLYKNDLFKKAYQNFKQLDLDKSIEYQRFIKENDWVLNYAIFVCFKELHELRCWIEWPLIYKNWIKEPTQELITKHQDQINYYIFLQYIFFMQWFELKNYANEKGIEIMGDIPYYVGIDSVDVWENQACFLLDEDGSPSFVAGVPPDYFAVSGQRWGNPIYDWKYLKKTDFAF